MLFSSMLFLWLFLPATLILDRLSDRFMGRKSANVILLIASLIFYAWGEPIYILLMLVSIFVNWALGCLIGKSKSRRTRRALMWLAVAADLGTLCCFKYLGVILGAFTAVTSISTSAVPVPPLPIGHVLRDRCIQRYLRRSAKPALPGAVHFLFPAAHCRPNRKIQGY